MAYRDELKIRVGTLVGGGSSTAEYIRQILPYGFESFSITFWQSTEGIDWKQMAKEVNEVLDGSDAVVSSLGVFGNPLESGPNDKSTLRAWEEAIDNAHLFGADIVGGFTGRMRGVPLHESMPRFREVWNTLGKRAGDKGVKIAFENCAMGGTWKSGDWNIAHTPVCWEMMFHEVPLENLGLEWEPCHQMTYLIDPMPQLREWAPRIFHMHGKDATVQWDVVRRYGIYHSMAPDIALPGQATPVPPFSYHRMPGMGDSNWKDIITELRLVGFVGSIDIEGWHDPVYRGDLEMTGQVHALNYLKECRGGSYIPNPQT